MRGSITLLAKWKRETSSFGRSGIIAAEEPRCQHDDTADQQQLDYEAEAATDAAKTMAKHHAKNSIEEQPADQPTNQPTAKAPPKTWVHVLGQRDDDRARPARCCDREGAG
ncbi:hypothetical protein, partial [Mesorhizobium sp. 14Argb]